jgi:hypothetical protein
MTHKSRDKKKVVQKFSVSRNMMKPIVAQYKPGPSLGGTKDKCLTGLEKINPGRKCDWISVNT